MNMFWRITMILDLIEVAGDIIKSLREWNRKRKEKRKRK